MALGKPVVTYLKPDVVERSAQGYGIRIPIVPATTESLVDALRPLVEQPALRQLYEQVLQTADREKQRTIFQQMERHTRDQAYFLFLYNPVQLYAVNKGVQFVPYVANLIFAESSVSGQHWSVRKGAEKKR